MSLHDIARHLQSQGRGEDTVLVHMTPQEVGGLQSLAKASGGSLTRNPQTGLYEAGFLSSVLPMVAGVAASAFLGPEMLPLVAGGIGLADYAMTGSVTQGLMAGLGAWSGFDLGSGIGAAGAADLAEQGADTSAKAFEESQAKALEAAGGDQINQTSAQTLAKNQLAGMNLPAGTEGTFNSAIDNAKSVNEMSNIMRGAGASAVNPTAAQGFGTGITSLSDIGAGIAAHPMAAAGAALPLVSGALFKQPTVNAPTSSVNTVNQPLQRLSPEYKGIAQPTQPNPYYTAQYPDYKRNPYQPGIAQPMYPSVPGYADGGLMDPNSEPVDFMGTDMYPQSQIQRSYYATPTQAPTSAQQAMASYEPKTNPLTGEPTAHMASGGISDLGSYSDGGRLLKGPGDGVSDDIPAQIGKHQPARLADGEFVIPARIVSELGNGSTDAGAKRLYAMMDRIQAKRKKSMGKGKFAVNSKAEKDLPA